MSEVRLRIVQYQNFPHNHSFDLMANPKQSCNFEAYVVLCLPFIWPSYVIFCTTFIQHSFVRPENDENKALELAELFVQCFLASIFIWRTPCPIRGPSSNSFNPNSKILCGQIPHQVMIIIFDLELALLFPFLIGERYDKCLRFS